MEESFEAHEKELSVLKDLVIATCKNVERMADDLKELPERVGRGHSMLTEFA